MLSKVKINKAVKIILVSALVIFLIGFAYNRYNNRICKDIIIKIDNQYYGNYFINEKDIYSLVTGEDNEFIRGKKYKNISLKNIELKIKSHKFVQNVQVYKDHEGNLIVKVEQSRPVARIIRNDGSGFYIGSTGEMLPLSEWFTARVVLVEIQKPRWLLKNEFLNKKNSKSFLELFKFIDNDKFWKAQIAQIVVKRNDDILLYLQVGKQVIEFGKPYNIEAKFKKLDIFLKEILPAKGWNKYQKVNLKFQDQIVCD